MPFELGAVLLPLWSALPQGAHAWAGAVAEVEWP